MSLFLYAAGGLLVALAIVDVLWTTLWIDGHAGPLTGRHTSWTRRIILVLARRNHRVLSLTGPVVIVGSVLVWAFVLWAGWTVFFSADPQSLVRARGGAAASLVDRAYFTGTTMFTLGNGDFSPQGRLWELTTTAASLSGMFLLTLSVTYLLAILEAVVAKRSFASQVWALGRTPEEFIEHCWDGREFPAVELQLLSLTEQLNLVTEQHRAYPLLHYYHEAEAQQSVPVNLAIFSEVLLLLAHAVAPVVRPAPSALVSGQRSVESFLLELKSAYITPAECDVSPPQLGRLRELGIPLVAKDEFDRVVREREDRRRLLQGFLDSERRRWPHRPDEA